MDEDLSTAILEYYKLKQQYEDKINRQKNRILKNESLSLQQKRKKVKQLKRTCIICKRNGGTIFSIKNGILKAICGSDDPCELNIEINRGNFVNIRVLDQNLTEDLEKIKTEIIKTKLDILFNYTNESDAIKKFNKLRPELKALEEIYFEWQKRYLDVVNNTDNKVHLETAQTSFFIEKEQLKNLGKKYNETGKQNIIIDMVEKYISEIEPLTERIRELKYKYVTVECDDGTSVPCNENDEIYLIEQPYTLKDLEADMGEGTGVLKNVK